MSPRPATRRDAWLGALGAIPPRGGFAVRAVVLALGTLADSESLEVAVSHADLRSLTGASENTVRGALQAAAETGYVVVLTPPGHGRTRRGRYRLTLPSVIETFAHPKAAEAYAAWAAWDDIQAPAGDPASAAVVQSVVDAYLDATRHLGVCLVTDKERSDIRDRVEWMLTGPLAVPVPEAAAVLRDAYRDMQFKRAIPSESQVRRIVMKQRGGSRPAGPSPRPEVAALVDAYVQWAESRFPTLRHGPGSRALWASTITWLLDTASVSQDEVLGLLRTNLEAANPKAAAPPPDAHWRFVMNRRPSATETQQAALRAGEDSSASRSQAAKDAAADALLAKLDAYRSTA